MRIILGSASPRRREIFSQAGICVEVMVSDCDENTVADKPSDMVLKLASRKAYDVWQKALRLYGPDDLMVIGADTVVAYENEIFGKPVDRDDAVRMLRLLSGHTHQVYTGVSVITKDKDISFVQKTDVTVYDVSDAEIEAYAESKEPMDKAGAYAIQGGFARYIKEIHGEYNNVVGFPIAAFLHQIKKAEMEIEV